MALLPESLTGFDTERTLAERVALARATVAAYNNCSPESVDTINIQDLISDLQHLFDVLAADAGLYEDWDTTLRLARSNHDAEAEEAL